MSNQDEARGGSPEPALPGGDFVARLVRDPANPPRTRLLRGYLGASAREEHTRIYLDLELRSWIDVPTDDVLHTQPAGAGPLAGALVWIRQAARVPPPGMGGGQRGGFFAGALWDNHFGETQAHGGGPGDPPTGRCQTPHSVPCPATARCPPTPRCEDWAATRHCPPTHNHCPSRCWNTTDSNCPITAYGPLCHPHG